MDLSVLKLKIRSPRVLRLRGLPTLTDICSPSPQTWGKKSFRKINEVVAVARASYFVHPSTPVILTNTKWFWFEGGKQKRETERWHQNGGRKFGHRNNVATIVRENIRKVGKWNPEVSFKPGGRLQIGTHPPGVGDFLPGVPGIKKIETQKLWVSIIKNPALSRTHPPPPHSPSPGGFTDLKRSLEPIRKNYHCQPTRRVPSGHLPETGVCTN